MTSMDRVTLREQEVLRLIALSNKEIAKALKIKECTVKNHIKNLILKFGVYNRRQLILASIRNGILTARDFVLTYNV